MAKQADPKFDSLVKYLQRLNESENAVKQKLSPSGKLSTPAIQVQPKMEPEVEGVASAIEGHEVKDKSEVYLKKSEEWLKGIDKTLKLIQESFAKNNSTSNKSDDSPGKSEGVGAGKLPDLPKDYTLTEGLKSTVGMAKSIGKGIAGFASNPKETLTKTFGNVKDSVKGALGNAKDILNAEAGYTPERERFAKGYAASAKGTQFQKGGKSALDAGKDKYDTLKNKQDEIDTIKEKMDIPASQGFSPLKKDQKELDTLNKEFNELDPRVAVVSPKVDKSPNEKITAASVNPESDNIETSGELISKEIRETNNFIGQNLSIVKLQLDELKGIRLALTPATPDEPNKDPNKRTVEKLDELIEAVKAIEVGGGGGGPGLTDLIPNGGKLATAGKAASKLGKFAKIGGAALAIGAGAYTAYQGWNAAEDSKQAKMDEVQAKVDSGQMKPEEAAAARKEIGNTATVEKSGAVGEGTGMAAGAIAGGLAGAKLGGTIGTFIGGPVGTAIGAGVGGLAGGALGAFAGSSAGKYVGEKAGEGINAIKGFFGGSDSKTPAAGEATKGAIAAPAATVKEEAPPVTFKKSRVMQDVVGGSTIAGYEKGYELQGKKEDVDAAEVAWKKFGKAEAMDDKAGMDAAANEFIAIANKIKSPEYKAKIKEISDKQNVKKEEKITGGPGAKTPSTTTAPSADTKATPVVESNSKPDSSVVSESSLKIGGEKVIPGQLLSQRQMVAIEQAKGSGNTFSPEIEALYAKQKQTAAVEPKTTGTTVGPEVAKASTENADLNREASRGTTNVTPIVSNSSSTNNNTSYVPVKPTPRNEKGGSALERYQDRVSAF